MNKQEIVDELSAHVKLNRSFYVWMGFLTLLLGVCIYAYILQLQTGLGVTGLRDFVSWGMYISHFVFFIATSLVGMLISSVLGLMGKKWITPIGRMAEIVSFAFAAVAGLVIVSDMGRPDRLLNVFIHGRFQSPILWDVTVVITYTVICLLLWFVPLIQDLAIIKNKPDIPAWQSKLYSLLSLGWNGNIKQKELQKKAIYLLLLLVIPVAISIHTVTSWLFAVNPRPGWASTIFGPYFVSGAFVSGSAAVIICMFIFRKIYKLQKYITEKHFNNMGVLLLVVTFVYFYFNVNEFLVPGYRMPKHEGAHLEALFSGHHAPLFWSVQIFGLILPMILLFLRPARKPIWLFLISIAVLIGAWWKRILIVVPTQEHPFLPIQNVPEYYHSYSPTLIESLITLGTFVMVIMIISVLAKVFPLIPIEETIHEKDSEINQSKKE